ncbi:type I polyketide synthase [Streptomyces stramineus]|uniref:Type I polyketide synthase n=1 Tax=Streptomyces stramineus TaxID=173861 RepID=A0ABP3JUN7_9ACTN
MAESAGSASGPGLDEAARAAGGCGEAVTECSAPEGVAVAECAGSASGPGPGETTRAAESSGPASGIVGGPGQAVAGSAVADCPSPQGAAQDAAVAASAKPASGPGPDGTARVAGGRGEAVTGGSAPEGVAVAECAGSASGPGPGETARAAGGPGAAVAEAVADGRVVFAFCGNGAQWAGMGADLLAADPAFREAVEGVDALLAPRTGWSVARALTDPPPGTPLSATEFAQPLLFTVQVALAETLRRRGVTPAAVLGHSVGEVAAAYTAGALTLEQAADVIAARGRAQAATAGVGGMAVVSLPMEQAEEALAAHPGLGVACQNTDRDVTVSGPTGQLRALAAELTARGVACTLLDVDYAFHSAAMNPVEEPLKTALYGLDPAPTRIPMISTVTGEVIEGTALDAGYWWRNVREPVLFAPAVTHLLGAGYDVFVDLGPHPVLRPYLRRLTEKHPTPVAVVPTLFKHDDGPAALRTAVATLAAAGADLDWATHFPLAGRVTGLPAYPWQRERHWNGSPGEWYGMGGDAGVDHPLLGDRLPLLEPAWRGAVEPVLVPWLADHRVGGSVVMPATGFVEMALAAGRRHLDAPAELEYLDITRALVVPWENPASIHLQVTLADDDGEVTIASATGRTGEPTRHARGGVRRLLRSRPAPVDVPALRDRCPAQAEPGRIYPDLAAAGLDYGPAFRTLRELRVGQGEVLAAYHHTADSAGYEIHPALLDGALQAGLPLMAGVLAGRRHAYLPGAIDAVRVWQAPPPQGLVHLRERGRTSTEVCWDITVTDTGGTVMAELEGCRLRRFDGLRTTSLTRSTTVMRAAPHPGVPAAPSPLPGPSELLAAAGPRIGELRAAWHRMGYERVRHRLKEALAAGFATTVQGLLPEGADSYAPEELTADLRPHHQRLCALLLPLLERHGLAERQEDGRWKRTGREFRLEETVQRVVRDHPAYAAGVILASTRLQTMGKTLHDGQEPLEFLAEGGAELVEQFFDISPWSRFHNRLLQALLTTVTDRWPADRPLRVLEVGAGTGGSTAALLPLLPADRTRYVFTDVSPLFVSRAERRFAAYDFVEYRPYDLDADPVEQGLTEGGFDLVVAANALHTAKDLAHALRGVHRLLAPGGLLLALELHDAQIIAPFFGTLESFWSHTDHALRPDTLVLPAARWPALLRRCGFTDVVRTGDGRRGAGADGSVLLAAVPDRPVAPTALPPAPGGVVWIVAGGGDEGLPEAVSGALETAGGTVVRATSHVGTPAQWEQLIPPAADDVTVVLLLGGDDGEPTPGELLDLTTRRVAVLRALADASMRLRDGVRLTLWLVTRPCGALPGPERPLVPHDAALWGITRTLANEHPRLTVRRLSLERTPTDPARDGRRVARELLTPTDEDEIALTARGRFVPRAIDISEAPSGTVDGHRTAAFALEVRDPGLAYRLAWKEVAPPAGLGPGEVVVAVRAAALNYRDLMQAVGILPADSTQGLTKRQAGPGLECAGVVEAVGEGVTSLAVGDRVFALAPGTFGSHAVTAEHAVGRMPEGMSFTEAATVPVVFLTVHYSLGHLARLAPGETVLVHGGAGGVGLAALQYARRRGAHVIATAGNPVKRDLLRTLGVEHVLDSRSLDFAEEIREITGGRGVDVVLNSLAGEAISRGLEALRPGGRFVELGKRDIHDNMPLRLRPFSRNIAFFGVDLIQLLHDPELAAAQFAEVAALVRRGCYRPLLHSVHPAARVAEAFRLMQHSRHIGKVVVSFDPLDEPPAVERGPRPPELDPRGTYLVTGGLGGFGAATARWLADRGARHLDLVGRRGADSPEASGLLAELASRGVRARARAADVCDPAAVRRLIEEADAEGRPLRGVVHSAMHVDDGLLTTLTDERIRAVLAPKMAGGAVLDALTRDRDLHLFLVYSSVTGTIGHVSQSAYVAGNLYLEALTRRRRQEGLSATAIAWGALGEAGYVARNKLEEVMTRVGIESVLPHEAFETVEEFLTGGLDVAGTGRYNWTTLHALLQSMSAPRHTGLVPALRTRTAPTRQEIIAELSAMAPEDAERLIADSLAQVLADVLQTPVEQIDHHRRLDTYGVDSLMATEVLTSLRKQYDVDIPPMELLRSNGTVADIARIIHLRLGLATTSAGGLPPGREPQALPAPTEQAPGRPENPGSRGGPDRRPEG